MKMEEKNERFELQRKFKEYEMKVIKMAGHLADYYIDKAIESDDFSYVSGHLIDYFSGSAGKPFEVGYLVSKYKEFELDEKIEDIDFDVEQWYRILHEIERPIKYDLDGTHKMTEEEYLQYLIEQRKKESEEDDR